MNQWFSNLFPSGMADISFSTKVTARHSLSSRKLVHMSMLGFAFLLPFLTWVQAAGAAVLALMFNLFILPSLGVDLRKRPDKRGKGRNGEMGKGLQSSLFPFALFPLSPFSAPDVLDDQLQEGHILKYVFIDGERHVHQLGSGKRRCPPSQPPTHCPAGPRPLGYPEL